MYSRILQEIVQITLAEVVHVWSKSDGFHDLLLIVDVRIEDLAYQMIDTELQTSFERVHTVHNGIVQLLLPFHILSVSVQRE